MFKKVTIIIAVALAAVVLLSACLRSAAPSKLATPTAKGSISISTSIVKSQPTPTATAMNLMEAWGTTTAVYVQTQVAKGAFTPIPPSQTPQPSPTPVLATATNTPILPATGVPTNTTAPGAATNTPLPGNTPVIVAPTATPGRPATYVLQTGEFPYCLARRFNVDPADLLSLNGLTMNQVVQPGLTLRIPQTGSFPGIRALVPHPAQYTVAVGDKITGIACRFGDVDPSAIAAANNLALTSPLMTGKILNIP